MVSVNAITLESGFILDISFHRVRGKGFTAFFLPQNATTGMSSNKRNNNFFILIGATPAGKYRD